MKSDPELQRDVEDHLARDPTLQARQVGVRARDGVVTLTGSTGSDLEHWQVVDAVRAVPGVRDLNDETMVLAAPSAAEPDGDVARAWFPP